MRYALSILATAFLMTACEHADPVDTGGIEPTLESIQTNIFNSSCAVSGCHTPPNPPMGLDLTAGRSRDNLVGVISTEVPGLFRVDPGNPDDSYLVIKLEGGSRMASGTQRMPLGRAPLSAEAIGAVRDWIADGAD